MVEPADRVPAISIGLTTSSPDETRRIASALGTFCRGGETILLYGDLGSGKTCFVQGLAEGLEVDPGLRVTSPTFTIHCEYPGRSVLNHLDLYRLDDPASLDGLGVEDMLADAEAVTAVEWPEMLAGIAPEALEVRLADLGCGRREITLSAYGPRHARLLQMLARY